MKTVIYDLIIKVLPRGLKKRIQYPLQKTLNQINISHSQEGEDIILHRFLGKKDNIFYIDIGAHHPTRFSNTKKFYDMGIGRGINIDALPGTKKLFDKERPEDINIECGVGLEEGSFTYYRFKEPALNTFERSVAEDKISRGWQIEDKVKIDVFKLDNILDKFEINKEIDFMSIDVEGKDLEVLQSNNWEKYRPNIICIEDLYRNSIEEILRGNLNSYLRGLNYEFTAKSYNTLFFIQK